MIDLVETIRRQHRRMLVVADRMVESYADWPLGEHRAKRAVLMLVTLQSRHEAAEASILWPVVRDVLPECAEQRGAAQAQERQARRALHLLHKVAPTAAAAGVAPGIADALAAHIDFEESRILSALATALSPNDALRIGRIYRTAFARFPSRPHPRVPDIPGVLALTSPVLEPVDRVRDLLRMP